MNNGYVVSEKVDSNMKMLMVVDQFICGSPDFLTTQISRWEMTSIDMDCISSRAISITMENLDVDILGKSSIITWAVFNSHVELTDGV